jgi:hypothetical protein
MLDLSYAFGQAAVVGRARDQVRRARHLASLDRYSPRYCPTQTPDALGNAVCDPLAPGFAAGREWELRSYLIVAW